MFQSNYNTEMHKSQRLTQEIQKLQKETAMAKTPSEAKENIWIHIFQSMTEIWPLIQILFEKHELVQRAREAINKIRGELGEKRIEATKIMKFLNSKTKEELEELEIMDRIGTILEVKKVLTNNGLMLHLEEKARTMDIGVQGFFRKVESVHKKGIPGLLVINDKLITLSEYKHKILIVEKDGSKFIRIQRSITDKAFLENLQLDLRIQNEIKYIFITRPNFFKYTEMDETYRRLLKVSIPSQNIWEFLCDLIE
jgi:hypothetical protein